MEATLSATLPIFLLFLFSIGLCFVLLLFGGRFRRKQTPTVAAEASDSKTACRKSSRLGLLLIALLVLNVELLFIFPWVASARPTAMSIASPAQLVRTGIEVAISQEMVKSRDVAFFGVMVFIGIVALGFLYDWRKGIFRYR